MKFLKTYNERLGDKLSAPNDDDILSKLKNLTTEEIVEQSLNNNFKAGFIYVLDNRKDELSDDDIYILEKYCLDKHQNEERPYEIWFKEQLTGLESYSFKYNKDIIIYKKNNVILFNYDLKNEIFYYDFDKIYQKFKSKFKLNYYYVKLLTKYMVKEHLNLSVKTTIADIRQKYWLVKEHLNLSVKTTRRYLPDIRSR